MKSFLRRNHRIIVYFALASSLILNLTSCERNIQQKQDAHFRVDTNASPRFARLFMAGFVHHHRAVWLFDPWDSTKIHSKYIILPHQLPNDSIPEGYQTVIVPSHTLATTSSTLIAHLSSLEILDLLIGVADTSYIFHFYVKNRIRQKHIMEIAQGDRVDSEALIACQPDLTFITLYPGQDVARLQHLGLQIVPWADYLENHPLGRAEWIRFIGYFMGKEKEADSIFHSIASRYLAIQRKLRQNGSSISIFDGLMSSGVWYVSGGQSYMARLYKDAGLTYVFSDLKETASKGLGFEEVFVKARDADYWRIMVSHRGNFTLNDLLNLDKRYELFEAVQKRRFIVCNAAQVPFYEEGVAHPEWILSDLVYLTRPQLMPDYVPRYYQIIR